MKRMLLRASLAALALAPGAAFAHTGIGDTHGFTHGFLHPLGGIDHQLAMILVGILAWRLGGRAVWLVPAAFVAMMALGGALGAYGVGIPFVEIGIAASVVILGLAVALGVKAPVALAMGTVGLFAIFHGHAHGTEMPLDASGAAYASGFIAATAALHAAGIAIGFLIGRAAEGRGARIYRIAGGTAAAAGALLLVSALGG